MLLTESSGIKIGQDIDVARRLFDRGDYDEAFALAMRVFDESADVDVKVRALLTASSCESQRGAFRSALKTLGLAGPFLDDAAPRPKASFFGHRAYLQTKLKESDGLVDYEAARFHAIEAGDKVAEARVRNNLAGCYRRAGRLDESLAECDAAIAIARRFGERHLLGLFYDQKAQTLNAMRRYEDAATLAKQAVEILLGHPDEKEARATYGAALVALGSEYLSTDDPVTTCKAKRGAAKNLEVSIDAELIQMALDRVGGRVAQAAHSLGVSHPYLITAIKRHKLSRQTPHRRAKALIVK